MANRIQSAFPASLPSWGGTQIEPDAGEKTTGFAIDDRPPAKWLNYLFDYQNIWLKMAMTSAFGNFTTVDSDLSSTTTLDSVVWNGSFWTALLDTTPFGAKCMVSYGGNTWAWGGDQDEPVGRHLGACDLAGNVIYGITGSSTVGEVVAYSSDPSTVNFASAPDPGFTGSATSVAELKVKQGSNLVLICRNSELAYTSSIGSAWTVVTTPAAFTELVHISGSTWGATTDGGAYYTSANDGVSWTVSTAIPVLTNYIIETMDVDRTTGAICAVAWDAVGTGNPIYMHRSTDLGATWSSYLIPGSHDTNTIDPCPKVRALGGAVWMMSSSSLINGELAVFYSVDDGLTWSLGSRFGGDAIATSGLRDLDYNGKTWVAVGWSASTAHGKVVEL